MKKPERKTVRIVVPRSGRTPTKQITEGLIAFRSAPEFSIRDRDPLPPVEPFSLNDLCTAGPETPDGNGSFSSASSAAVRNPDHRVSFRDEMLVPDDFDTGRFKAMIVPDTSRPGRPGGFVRIPSVWGVRLAPPVNVRSAPLMLAEAVNRYTDIEARMEPHLTLDAHRLSSTPFLYITTDEAFELTPTERERFGDYLRSGGFAFLDTAAPRFEHDPGGASLKQMLRDALGCHARFVPIPATHPIYHCFFEFDGPPVGDELNHTVTSTVNNCGTGAENIRLKDQVIFLEGIFLDNRLVAIYSAKGYGTKWRTLADSAPQMKFGVNLVVYALTREGGMTARAMEGYTDTW